jgi:O-antigen ligase
MTFLKNKKTGLLFTLLALTVGGLIYLNSTDIQHRLNASFSTGSDHTRFELLQVHWQMFKAHPFIGIGFFESYRQIADYWPMIGLAANHFESHAHNQYLNVLATTGLIGFVFFISIFVYFIRLTLKMINANTQLKLNYAISISILILILQFALACLTDVTFEYAKIRGLLVIGLALLISLKFKTKQDLL